MMMDCLRSLLYRLPPERAHDLTIHALSYGWAPNYAEDHVALQQTIMGLSFPHPVGMSAGFDKDGKAVHALAKMGFSFIEVGTVTPLPQPGNSRPRLFRYPDNEAIINRMGFNNDGVMAMVKRLSNRPDNVIIGVNIGKNKDTPQQEAIADYRFCYRVIHPYADYVTINISSPNTTGLRDLQSAAYLRPLFSALKEDQYKHQQQQGRYVPLAVKIAPDLTSEQVVEIAQLVTAYNVDTVISNNTSIIRPDYLPYTAKKQQGGLSGKPIYEASNTVLQLLYEQLQGRVPIIASGGIYDKDAALQKMMLGANLIQLYTGFVYKGPRLISDILQTLRAEAPLLNDRETS